MVSFKFLKALRSKIVIIYIYIKVSKPSRIPQSKSFQKQINKST